MKEIVQLENRSTDGKIILNSGVDYIHPAQDGDQWRSLMNTAIKFLLSSNVRNF
jgi:hypothetical protein